MKNLCWLPFVAVLIVSALVSGPFLSCGSFGSGAAAPSAGADPAGPGEWRDGVYEGSGPGWRGPVLVRVRLESGKITEVEILDHEDDPFTGGAAMEELAELVLEYNTVDLDGISGATESSSGFLAAVEAALTQGEEK
jgi:uncharacterized protein with FMN-binding domain